MRPYPPSVRLLFCLVSRAAAWGLVVGAAVTSAHAQSRVGDFATEPILVLGTGGHHATVKALAFTPDGATLLSAGDDKVVLAWDLATRSSEPVRTIRPPLWRGYIGSIYAMALSPAADAQGQRVLAVAGWNPVERGAITLYRFPGRTGTSTGDLIGTLGSAAAAPGHRDVVHALTFSADGSRLASAADDGTICVWDMATRTGRTLARHPGPVRAIAFTPDAARLVAGGSDGQNVASALRVWDVANGQLLGQVAAGAAINTLAVAPDGRRVVIGREANGGLERYDLTTGDWRRFPAPAGQGVIESVAISPDGSRVVTSAIARAWTNVASVPPVDCQIGLYRLETLAAEPPIATSDNLVRAVAFTPDGRHIAFAGGDRQAVRVWDLTARGGPSEVFEGQGRGQSVWDVGFGPQGLVAAYRRDRAADPAAAGSWEAFDLATRRFVDPIAPDQLRRGLETWQGWSVRPVSAFELDVVPPANVAPPWRLSLNPTRERRWWAWSFIPPAASHPSPVLAVACEGGVAMVNLETKARTHFLAAHEGHVYALAPSADGAWLLTGSADQTLRLWPLAGIDTRPTFGAKVGRKAEGWAVDEVSPRGFAQSLGLKPGDVITRADLDLKPLAADADLQAAADAAEPNNDSITVHVRRDGRDLAPIFTTKRDLPALTVFTGLDREWVAWMPEGYYETSIAGDVRHLGWHVNNDFPRQPTTHFPAVRYENRLRRPDVLDRLLTTGDPVGALAFAALPVADPAQPPPVVLPPPPAPALPAERIAAGPRIVVVEPLGVIGQSIPRAEGRLTVRCRVEPAQGRAVGSVVVNANGRLVPAAPGAEAGEFVAQVDLIPGDNQLALVANDDQQVRSIENFEVKYQPPAVAATPEPARPSRLVVRTVGVDEFTSGSLPAILFASRDADDLGKFLAAPGGRARFAQTAIDAQSLPAGASAEQVIGLFETLESDLEAGRLAPGDTVFVALVTHWLGGPKGGALAGADATDEARERLAGTSDRLAEILGRLVNYGCTVVVFLDATHEGGDPARRRGLQKWVRHLQLDQRAIVLLASKNDEPGRRPRALGHGPFAQAILTSLDAASANRARFDPNQPVTLGQFADSVKDGVYRLARQYADCYVPETGNPRRLALFEPRIPTPSASPASP